MDDPFDSELKNRIKEVFENFEDTSADEGWLQLREKFPEEQSDRRVFAWIWWGAAAAVLLLFLGIGTWMYNDHTESAKLSYKPLKNNPSEKVASHSEHHTTIHKITPGGAEKPANNTTTGHLLAKMPDTLKSSSETNKNKYGRPVIGSKLFANNNSSQKRVIAKSSNNAKTSVNNIHQITPVIGQNLANTTTGHFNTKGANPLKTLPKTNNYAQPVIGAKLFANDASSQKRVIAKKTSDSIKTSVNNNTDAQLAATQPNTVKTGQEAVIQKSIATANPNTVSTTPVQAVPQQPARTMANVFEEEKNKTNQKKTDEKTKPDAKKVRFGVYAATYFNYAKGSDNQLNVGGGFSSDIAINKNLKLVTGVAITQNTLNYTGAVPTAAAIASDTYYPASLKTNYPTNSYAVGIAAIPSFKNYNASLVGLDIPLNLKYEFNPQKADTYVIAGLSSGTFINEAYTYQYNYPSFNSTSTQQTEGQTTTKNFNSFYFAKTLNVAFGVGYPLGKNHLIIEPFLKYPLEGLGAQQIRFGAGGLNLKFSFQTAKK